MSDSSLGALGAHRFSLDGHIGLVTGAGSGIGQSIAWAMAQAGSDVACLDTDSDAVRQTVDGVVASGGRGLALTADVRDEESLRSAVTSVESDLGPLSLAVNSAGIANAGPAESMPLTQWNHLYDINVAGVFMSCREEARVMLPRGAGAIVNVASMSGTIANRGLRQVHYNSAKAAVAHMTKSLAVEWAERGLRVNAVSPGYTATPMNVRPEVADQTRRFASETPLGRMAQPDEIAGPAVFLLSAAASFCTGVDLLVDGGFCCW